jgi:ABC-type dipeptide/oligopeptide/nickel transport system permease subunit
LIAATTLSLSDVIQLESVLSFLGLGRCQAGQHAEQRPGADNGSAVASSFISG